MAAGGGAKAYNLVDFDSRSSAFHTVQEAVAGASQDDTITLNGGSMRPWNGESTYVMKPVVLTASDGPVFLGGMRTTLDIQVLGDGTLDATSAYTGSHPAPVSKSVTYATQTIACFLGERLTMTPVVHAPGAFRTWSASAHGQDNPLAFQVLQAGLKVVAEFAQPGPDLAATWQTQPPATAKPGGTVPTSVRIANIGQQETPQSQWIDGIYLSRDAVFDPGDLALATHTYNGALPSGSWYNLAVSSVQLPDVAPGRYFLLAVTNSISQVTETIHEDNVAASQLIVLDAVLAK